MRLQMWCIASADGRQFNRKLRCAWAVGSVYADGWRRTKKERDGGGHVLRDGLELVGWIANDLGFTEAANTRDVYRVVPQE